MNDRQSTVFEKMMDFARVNLTRSRTLGRLLFRTARLENERKKILQTIGQYYCDLYDAGKEGFQAPETLSALFSKQRDLTTQIKAHYDEIDQPPIDADPGPTDSTH